MTARDYSIEPLQAIQGQGAFIVRLIELNQVVSGASVADLQGAGRLGERWKCGDSLEELGLVGWNPNQLFG